LLRKNDVESHLNIDTNPNEEQKSTKKELIVYSVEILQKYQVY